MAYAMLTAPIEPAVRFTVIAMLPDDCGADAVPDAKAMVPVPEPGAVGGVPPDPQPEIADAANAALKRKNKRRKIERR